MDQRIRVTARTRWFAAALLCAVASGACKRVNEGEHPQTMNPASSEVMSNSAGANGTPGESDAASRVHEAPPGTSVVSPAAPVTTTPAPPSAPGTGGTGQ